MKHGNLPHAMELNGRVVLLSRAWLVSKTINKNVTCRQSRVIKQIHYAQCFVDGVDLARLGLAEGMMVLTKDQDHFPSPADYKTYNLQRKKHNKDCGLANLNNQKIGEEIMVAIIH
nr:hypothetical protein [Bartonella washoeensis]